MKILVLFTGGTIGSKAENGFISPDSRNAYTLLSRFGSRPDIEFETAEVYNILSENADGTHLRALTGALRRALEADCGGIIVTHGTDTLCYCAAAAGLSLGMCEKPVVFVSSGKPLDTPGSNGEENFSAAVSFICACRERGVFVSYKNAGDTVKIHRAARLLMQPAYSDFVFSICNVYMYSFTGEEFVKNPVYAEFADEAAPLILHNEHNARILSLAPSPVGVYPVLTGSIDAVLLHGYHSGTLPTSCSEFISFCKMAQERNIPLFIAGGDDSMPYESKSCFSELGINVLRRAAPAAMLMKLWLIISSEREFEDMYKSIGGDILPDPYNE